MLVKFVNGRLILVLVIQRWLTPVCQLVKRWRFSLETLVFLQFSGTDLVFEVKFKAEYNEIKLNFHMHIWIWIQCKNHKWPVKLDVQYVGPHFSTVCCVTQQPNFSPMCYTTAGNSFLIWNNLLKNFASIYQSSFIKTDEEAWSMGYINTWVTFERVEADNLYFIVLSFIFVLVYLDFKIVWQL